MVALPDAHEHADDAHALLAGSHSPTHQPGDPLRPQQGQYGPGDLGSAYQVSSQGHGSSSALNPFYGGDNPSYASNINSAAEHPPAAYGTYEDDESKIPLTGADEKYGYPPQSSSSYK